MTPSCARRLRRESTRKLPSRRSAASMRAALSGSICTLSAARSTQAQRQDGVAVGIAADLEAAFADLLEAVAGVEGQGARIAGVHAEQQAAGAARARFGDRLLHQLAADAAAVEAREQVDALELEVVLAEIGQGQLRRRQH